MRNEERMVDFCPRIMGASHLDAENIFRERGVVIYD